MHYAFRRQSKMSRADALTHSNPMPRHALSDPSEQTIGESLRANVGSAYSEAWLANALACSPAAAAELATYWIPLESPHLLKQAVGVFANALDLDAQRLLALLWYESSPQRISAPAFRPESPAQHGGSTPRGPVVTTPVSAPPQRMPQKARGIEISIGSNEGVRVVKQRQPTIVYRKSRKLVAQSLVVE